LLLSEQGYDCSVVCVLDILCDLRSLKNFNKCKECGIFSLVSGSCDDISVCLCCKSVICFNCESLAYVKAALDSVVTVDYCDIYIGKGIDELLGSDLNEFDILGIIDDIFYSCIDTCIITESKDTLLLEEKKCSSFVGNVVGNSYQSSVGKFVKVVDTACIDTEGFIVDCTDGYKV